MRTFFWVVLIAWFAGPPAASRAEPAKDTPEDPAHAELRNLRDNLIDAVNKDDRPKLMALLEKNVVVTFMDGTTVRGHDGLQKYLDSKLKGSPRIVESFSVHPTVDELSILYGSDTAISFGSSDDQFKLSSGLDFTVHNRWTATVVKEDGKWLIAAFHASAGLFDNPLLATAKRLAYWVGGGGVVIGLLIGWLIGRRRRAVA